MLTNISSKLETLAGRCISHYRCIKITSNLAAWNNKYYLTYFLRVRKSELGWWFWFRVSYKVVVKMLARATVIRRFDGAGGSITKLAPPGPRFLAGCSSPPGPLKGLLMKWPLVSARGNNPRERNQDISSSDDLVSEVAYHLFCFIQFVSNESLDSAHIARGAPSLKGRSVKAFVNTFLNHQKIHKEYHGLNKHTCTVKYILNRVKHLPIRSMSNSISWTWSHFNAAKFVLILSLAS